MPDCKHHQSLIMEFKSRRFFEQEVFCEGIFFVSYNVFRKHHKARQFIHDFLQFPVSLTEKTVKSTDQTVTENKPVPAGKSYFPEMSSKDLIILILINQHAHEGGALYVLEGMKPFGTSVPFSQTGQADTFLPVVKKYISLQLF